MRLLSWFFMPLVPFVSFYLLDGEMTRETFWICVVIASIACLMNAVIDADSRRRDMEQKNV